MPAVAIEDHFERRIRKPADLLRLVTGCVGLAILVGAAVVARATETGAETDLSRAAHHLTHTLLTLLAYASGFVLLVLPVALAVRQFVRGQPRRFAEAAATGAVTIAVVAGVNALLRLPAAAHLAAALTVTNPAHAAALDGYLAAFAAYVTVIDLGGRQALHAVVWATVGVYVVTSLVAIQATILSLAITLVLGRTIGVAFRYVAGLPSQRPTALQIATALSSSGLQVIRMSRITQVWEASRCYAATTYGGDHLDVEVFDRDQETAGALYRLYRVVRLRNQVSRGLTLSLEHAVERSALMTYALADAAVATPRLRAAVRVSSEAIALAHDHPPAGTTLAERAQPPTDAQLSRVWDTVLRMHARDITHRALTADRIFLTSTGDVMLLDPGHGDVAASDLQRRLDLAQLLAELALLVGPDRAADGALAQVGGAKLAGVVPLLQPVALYRSTRQALRRHHDVLPTLRSRLLAEAPDGEVAAPVRLERVRLRTLVTLILGVVVAYVLVGQLTEIDIPSLIRHAQWQWTAVALALSALSYVAAAVSLIGFVPEQLKFGRTMLAQLAASFVTLVTPAAVGGATLNIRYLQRSGVPPAKATASVGAAQVIAFVLHILLLVIFAALTGASTVHTLRPPDWVYYVLAGLVVLVLAAMAVPRGRRLVRARLAPALGQVLPRLLDLLHSPRKLAEGLGGALGLTLIYVLCLAACVHALGGSVSLTGIAVVYLTGSAIGSAAPTPGGLGAVEVALSAGLTAAGLASATALSAVLLFRLLTFWLPVPVGWAAFNSLQRKHAL
jgi:glycosyltransferase 2 family protein